MVASMIKASGAGDGESNCMKWPSRPQDLPEKKTVGNDKGKRDICRVEGRDAQGEFICR
jgi:hypothetical protein